jgi:hypothetical protein
MGATRRRANQLAAAEGQAAREVAAEHAEFVAGNKQQHGAPRAATTASRRPPPPPPQPWWVGYLTRLALAFAFWAFTRMLLRNQAFLSEHKHPV